MLSAKCSVGLSPNQGRCSKNTIPVPVKLTFVIKVSLKINNGSGIMGIARCSFVFCKQHLTRHCTVCKVDILQILSICL